MLCGIVHPVELNNCISEKRYLATINVRVQADNSIAESYINVCKDVCVMLKWFAIVRIFRKFDRFGDGHTIATAKNVAPSIECMSFSYWNLMFVAGTNILRPSIFTLH